MAFIISLTSWAKSPFEKAYDEILQIRQLLETETVLKEYFNSYIASDTVFAIIFPPANCPRCEALITPTLQKLKQYRPEIPTVLVAAYPDSVAASQYMGRYGLTADDIMYDTSEHFRNFLSFSMGTLHIPYLLKLTPADGNLIVGLPADVATDEFLLDFCAWKEPMEKREYGLSGFKEGHFRPAAKKLTANEQLRIVCPDSVLLSETVYRPEFYHDKLFFNDKLREATEYFRVVPDKQDILEFRHEIRTTPSQNRTFIELPDSTPGLSVMLAEVRYIPLSPKMIDNRTLAISYSLPKVWSPAPYSFGYMNVPCLLMMNPDSVCESRVIPLTGYGYDKFYYPHFSLFRYGDDVAIGCERKTWPLELDKEDYCDKPEFNPFTDDFYTFIQPISAVFDREGRLKCHLGQLPELARHTLTGYYFLDPVIDSWNGTAVMSDGFSGDITLFSIDNPNEIRHLTAFSIPDNLLPSPDPETFYSYECAAPYAELFNRNITDMRLTDTDVYLLIRYGQHGIADRLTDDYSVIRIGLDCDCAEEKSFAIPTEGTHFFGLRRTADGYVQPYMISNHEGDWKVTLYDFDN